MDPVCGLDVALHYIGGKWKPILLFHLQHQPRRFGELKRLAAGISEKVLIQQLRDLTDAGILTRHDFREVPPRVEYTITGFGRTLALALQPLCEWGNANRQTLPAAEASADA
ncbi:winged helix-turn-helix transcriptional regulator [Chimaeribacter coloradensis]|nr:helix-turn-helix domain-containing protein [Chimaeribacter coloradensis]